MKSNNIIQPLFNSRDILIQLGLTLCFVAFAFILTKIEIRRTPKKKLKELISLNTQLEGVKFAKIELGVDAIGKHTSIRIGPDNKLYANTLDGQIKRFLIKEDGTIQLEHVFGPFGTEKKTLIGLEFDKEATAENLTVWITYCNTPSLKRAPNWDGRVARLKLSPFDNRILENTLVITHLPRSAKDHLTNGLAFGPDGALYINQGSNSPMGKANDNPTWMQREETLLAGAILRLDVSKLPKKLPLDVKTDEEGGKYDPFANDAPLTIFATGFRNPYDLVWHSNGSLYSGVNGASAGGATPTNDTKDPNYIKPHPHYTNDKKNPARHVQKVKTTQHDWLFRIEKGGYYGHPNPRRAEYVLNRGDIDVDNPEYNGIKPDANYRGASYDFGLHVSPNGMIEYTHNVFEGKLKGMLMIVRFNEYNDVMLLKPDSLTKDIKLAYDGVKLGLGGMNMPLDICQDTRNGNLYVAEYGGAGKIVLFKPSDGSIEINPEENLAETEPEIEEKINETNVTVSLSTEAIKKGKLIFEQNCVVCHGEEGEGNVGPSLLDNEWLYGKDIKSIFKTIKYGAKNGMQAWKGKLKAEEIQEVSSYILKINAEAQKSKLSFNQ